MTNIVNRSLTIRSGGAEICCRLGTPKSNVEEVRVSVSDKDARLVDLWIYADFEQVERKPTRKDVTFSLRHTDCVVAALEQAKVEPERLRYVLAPADLGDAR